MALSKIDAANFLTGTIPQGNVANASLGAVTALPAAIPTGKVLQVSDLAQASSAQTFSSTSYADLTNVTVNITPSSTSNKILILANIGCDLHDSEGYGMQFVRGSTSIYATKTLYTLYSEGAAQIYNVNMFNYYDSPNSTSQQTYKVQIRSYNNQSMNISTSYNSNIQVMEIAG